MNETERASAGGGGAERPAHPAEIKLRRLRAGEWLGDGHGVLTAHIASCVDCSKRLDALADEQRAFEQRIPFERFAAGVIRTAHSIAPAHVAGATTGRADAATTARSLRWWNRPASTRSFITMFSLGAVATCLVLVAGVRPIFEHARQRESADRATTAANRIKGPTTAGVDFRIAAADDGPQRSATSGAPERLSVGERIRVGVVPGARRFLFAFSIDEGGIVTPLYPEVGTSMPLPNGGRMQYLPDSLELTGRGGERVIVVLTDVPLEFDTVRRAAAGAFRDAGGNLARLPRLALPGEQFHHLFLKP